MISYIYEKILDSDQLITDMSTVNLPAASKINSYNGNTEIFFETELTDIQKNLLYNVVFKKYTIISATDTITTTSNSFSVVSNLTYTPAQGTYVILFGGNVDINSGANGTGEVAIFSNNSQLTQTTREIRLNVSLLLGVIGTAHYSVSGSHTLGVATVDGKQTIDVRFRSTSGNTLRIRERNMILIKVV